MSLAAGNRVGPYEILSWVGEGGMGAVYRARDTRLGREVALKLLSQPQDVRSRERFQREAQLASAISHANVVALYDLGEHEGHPYLVTELLQGTTLRELIARGPMPWRSAASLALQVAEGLSAAHEKGIIHRDLKPDNLFIGASGQVKILDFGIARLLEPASADAATVRNSGAANDASQITTTGMTVGTPSYMSPEQLRAERVDARSDLFGFGCVLYELLAGRRPFVASTGVDIAVAILQREPAPLPLETPPPLARLVASCLQKSAADRPQSARAVISALRVALGMEAIELPAGHTETLKRAGTATPQLPAETGKSTIKTLFSELQRRSVNRALLGYGALAFGILQIIEPIMHGLHWPDEVLGYVVIALGAGFPVVVALAWMFDLKAGRLERTAPMAAAPRALRGARLGFILFVIGALAASPGLIWLAVRSGLLERFGSAKQTPPAPAQQTMAVLPFENLSGDSAQDYFGDGISQELISKLSHLKGLTVAARTASGRFKGTKTSNEEIGNALHVEYLLEGSFRRTGSRVLISAALLKANDGFQVWSNQWDGTLDDIFTTQQAIATRIVDSLALRLTPEERSSLSRWGTRNPDAYDQYLRGEELFAKFSSEKAYRAATAHFEAAIAIDAQFAPAMGGMARSEAGLYRVFGQGPEHLARAEQMAKKALEIDPGLSEARLAQGYVRLSRYQYADAAADARKLLALEPGNAAGMDLLGWMLAYVQPPQLPEAIEAGRQAVERSPGNPMYMYHTARALALAGRIDEARKVIAPGAEAQPDNVYVKYSLFWIELCAHRPTEALAWAKKGDANELWPAQRAMAYGQLGELDQAFAELEVALARGYRDIPALRGSPWFEPLRRDPRFDPLLAKHGIINAGATDPEVPPTAPSAQSIAVLPFENLSGDKAQDYFGDGLTQELISKLSRLHGMEVAARTAVMQFKGSKKGPKEIGAALGVIWLLEGSVRRSGNRVRISALLMKAADGKQVWSDDQDGKAEDIFSFQQLIAAKIAEALQVKLTPEEKTSLSNWGTRNPEAYDEFLKGQQLSLSGYNGSLEEMKVMMAHQERALEIDPNFAPALALLASNEFNLHRGLGQGPEHLVRAEALVERALQLDPSLAVARLAHAWVRMGRYDYETAVADARAVLEAEPRNTRALAVLGQSLAFLVPPRLDESIDASRRALRAEPEFQHVSYHLSRALALAGQTAEARKVLATMEERHPDSFYVASGRFWLQLCDHHPREALVSLEVMRDGKKRVLGELQISWQAIAHGQSGELDQAFVDLEKALALGFRDVPLLRRSPWFEPLRKDPRFEPLLSKHAIPN